MTVRHPAKFSDSILDGIVPYLQPRWKVLDPFAGVGVVHSLRDRIAVKTVGVELEPEWANQHPDTIVGDALALPPRWRNRFDAVVTSPTYGNRLADHQDAQERCRPCGATGEVDGAICTKCGGEGRRAYKRITYRHTLGRPLTPGNSGSMQWGTAYRKFHRAAWTEALRVIKPGGRLIINVSDHVRGGEVQHVTDWHVRTILGLGTATLYAFDRVGTVRMRYGANRDLRVPHEAIVVFTKVA